MIPDPVCSVAVHTHLPDGNESSAERFFATAKLGATIERITRIAQQRDALGVSSELPPILDGVLTGEDARLVDAAAMALFVALGV